VDSPGFDTGATVQGGTAYESILHDAGRGVCTQLILTTPIDASFQNEIDIQN